MKTIVERAAAGQRAAMTELYKDHRKKMYHTALLLLGEKKQAAGAAAAAFRKIWKELGTAGISTEAQFANYAVIRLAEHCRGKLGKTPEAETASEHPFLAGRSAVEKAVFVLHTAGGLGPVHAAKALKVDPKVVRGILESLPEGFDGFAADVKAQQAAMEVPAWVDEKAAEAIEAVAGPAEKAEKKRRKVLGIAAAAVFAVIAAVILVTVFTGGSGGTVYADINIADHGTVTLALDADAAPVTVKNFVDLAESGYYDGLTFHRIMEGFMMQGGCPLGNGTGGSGKTIVGEFAANGHDNPISHKRGVVSMARSTSYDSASSQFFICHADSVFLDGQYAAFGYVTEGMDIVDRICEEAQPIDDNGTIPAAQQPVILSIVIRDGEK